MSGTPHEIIEKNTGLLVIGIVIAISFATLVEIVPLIYDNKGPEEGGVNAPLPAMEPWTALEFEGPVQLLKIYRSDRGFLELAIFDPSCHELIFDPENIWSITYWFIS